MATVPLSGAEREQVRDAYVVTALWTATNEDGEAFDDYTGKTVDDLSTYAAEEIGKIVDGFIDMVEQISNPHDIDHTPALADPWAGMDAGQIGHDLYLTSAHHGAGFWDRGLGERGDALTKWAQIFTPPFISYIDANGTEWMA